MSLGCLIPIACGGVAGVVLAIEHESNFPGLINILEHKSPFFDTLGIFSFNYLMKIVDPPKPYSQILDRTSQKSSFFAESIIEGGIMTASATATYILTRGIVQSYKYIN